MVDPLVRTLALMIVLASGGYVFSAARAWEYRDTSTGSTFVAMALSIGLFGVVYGGLAFVDPVRLQGNPFLQPATLFVLVPWGAFVLTYTGWRRPVTSVSVSGAIVLVGLSIASAVYVNLPGETLYGVLGYFTALTGSVGTLATIGLGMVGTSLLIRSAYRNDLVSSGLGAGLIVCGIGPWLSMYLIGPTLAFRSIPGWLGVVAAGYVVGTAGVLLAVTRYDVLETTPAATTLGRSTVIAELDEPVVVVDCDEQIVDLNAAAEEVCGSSETSLGESLSTVLDAELSTLERASVLDIHTDLGHRDFTASVSTITDEHDRAMGHAVLLQDVTEERTREQRLEVLNRVLRHNLRNDLNVVEGYTEIVEDVVEHEDALELLSRIQTTASSLSALGEQARKAERLVAAPRVTGKHHRLSAVVDHALVDLRDEYPDASITVDLGVDPELRLNASVIEQVVHELVENAIVHSDRENPTVEVHSAHVTGDCPLAITVVDDGPGIPDHEWSVVTDGDESALEHGSGLGLWVVNWGVTRLGGHLDFAERDPRGSAVTVSLPEAVNDSSRPASSESGQSATGNHEPGSDQVASKASLDD